MTLFVHQLRDIYYAEKQIVQSLPEMIEKATDSNLKRGFETHLGETKNHVNRLEQVFKMHGVEAKAIDFPAIDEVIEEATSLPTSTTKKCSTQR
jgi:ferritin-like metal-binding protein YciE